MQGDDLVKKDKIVFDLEATCESRDIDKNYDKEIIEIGAVKIRGKEIVDEFSIIIKPKDNPTVTDYCLNLTGITQDDVNNGVSFKEGSKKFIDWSKKDNDNVLYIAWSDFDRWQFNKDCKRNNIDFKLRKYMDLREFYKKKKGITSKKTISLRKTLNKEDINFEGRQHRALDDAKNTAKLYLKILKY